MIRLFESVQHADLYKKYRRATPPAVVKKALEYLEEKLPRPHGTAVDVGCGSGQNTLCFAPYFGAVHGYDVSPSQVGEASKTVGLPSNVTFGVAPAEAFPLADGSVEFVTGGSSLHYFDFDKFHAEVDRVLVPNGVLAAVGYGRYRAVHPTKTAELRALEDAFFDGYLAHKQHPRTQYAFDEYRDLPLPYDNDVVRYQDIPLDVNMTVSDLMGSYMTWSPFQAMYKESPERIMDALTKFQTSILKVLEVDTPAEETPIVVRYNFCLAMCRKPANAH